MKASLAICLWLSIVVGTPASLAKPDSADILEAGGVSSSLPIPEIQIVSGVKSDVTNIVARKPRDVGAASDKEISDSKDSDSKASEDSATNVDKYIASAVDSASVELPAELNSEAFRTLTSERLSLVEFYSPYCSHCKAFAPTWEKTFKEYHQEMSKLNIQMLQVNCVEQGDLCTEEEIDSYPNIRLYSPEKDKEGNNIPGKSKFVGSIPRTLVRSVENIKKFMKNAVAEYNTGITDLPSASKLLSVDEVLNVIAGQEEEAYFVAFFPATNQEFERTDTLNRNYFDKTCTDCLEHKKVWDKLSNIVLSRFKTGHFNCFDNPSVCKELGLNKLSSGHLASPKYAFFLPKTVGIIRIDYTGEVLLQEMKSFSDRLYENFQYEIQSARGLQDVMDYRKGLPFKPLDLYYPLKNKVSIVFYYDMNTITEEDRDVLPHLLEYVTKSPFNTYLYTAKHAKIEQNIKSQAENLIEFINYDEDTPPYTFDNSLYTATTLSTKPTILVLKDNTLITNIFQSFNPEDIRDFKKIELFLNKNQYPLYQELNPKLLPTYFNKKDDSKSDKVVITFIDSENADHTNQALYNMSIAAHEYYHLKQKYYFDKVLSQREEKNKIVKKLKEQNAESSEIIQVMRKEVPHLYSNDDILFTFIDLSKIEDFKHTRGWKVGRKYGIGDSIILSKDNVYFWEEDFAGKQIKNDPYVLKPILQSLLRGETTLHQKLLGSPYGRSLEFMDHIHARGFFGYIYFLGLIFVVGYGVKKVWKSRNRERKGGRGILGNLDKKD